MEFDKLDLSEKEKQLFAFGVKVHADPHGITDADTARLREVEVTDQEMVEVIEVVNFANSINLFCDALGIGADAFLTYEMDKK